MHSYILISQLQKCNHHFSHPWGLELSWHHLSNRLWPALTLQFLVDKKPPPPPTTAATASSLLSVIQPLHGSLASSGWTGTETSQKQTPLHTLTNNNFPEDHVWSRRVTIERPHTHTHTHTNTPQPLQERVREMSTTQCYYTHTVTYACVCVCV